MEKQENKARVERKLEEKGEERGRRKGERATTNHLYYLNLCYSLFMFNCNKHGVLALGNLMEQCVVV